VHRLIISLMAFCFLLLTACQRDDSPALAEIKLHDIPPVTDIDRMMEAIIELSSDEYGGREPMSEGERLTLDFIENRFREMGLDPLFGESYRQAVDLVAIEADPTTVHMSFRIDGADRPVRHLDEMVLGTSRVVESSRVQDSELVFVGYGVVAPEYGWNDYEGVDVEGKTVLILINDPGFASQDPGLFKGTTMTYYGRWTYKYEEAARQGAAAAIIIHDSAPAAYGWKVVRNGGSGPRFYLDRENNNMDRLPLQSWITKALAQELLESAGLDLASLEQQALAANFGAVALGITMDAGVENKIVRKQSYNVGAKRSGGERPRELFIYTAHWDHIGTDPSLGPEEDSIYNGAVDNATGIAALMELARSFAALPRAPERSVAFLAVTAEESGLLGSARYAEAPPIPMRKTVGGLNMDSLLVHGPTRDVTVVGYGSSELEDILRQEAEAQGRVLRPEEHPERGIYYRSDHFNFARRGVPMLYAEAGSDHLELGPDYIREKNAEYLENRYHTPLDEVGEDWDLRGMVQDIELYFGVGLTVADSDLWPEWYEGNEFRSVRQHSMKVKP
jgi:Zn-dependent M28 family amino/carboxypeptidase